MHRVLGLRGYGRGEEGIGGVERGDRSADEWGRAWRSLKGLWWARPTIDEKQQLKDNKEAFRRRPRFLGRGLHAVTTPRADDLVYHPSTSSQRPSTDPWIMS